PAAGVTASGGGGALAAYAAPAPRAPTTPRAVNPSEVTHCGSRDGTLARVRRAERPRYGYYLDHIVDAFSTAAIGAGIGLSPYVKLGVALAGSLACLLPSIHLYLAPHASGLSPLG